MADINSRRGRLHTQVKKQPSHLVTLVCFLLLFALAGAYSIGLMRYNSVIKQEFIASSNILANTAIPVTQTIPTKVGHPAIVLAKQHPFRANSMWVYVAKSHPLPQNFVPSNLVPVLVPTTTSDAPLQLQNRANDDLSRLFSAAKQDGHALIVASAYRSAADQRKVYDESVMKIGALATTRQVAKPGASEHQTGLAVDVDTYSLACKKSVDVCSIDSASADWLAKHAATYGFIVRYPENKESVTSIHYEPWHLRYLGKDATRFQYLKTTFDEFATKIDPSIAPIK